ncbi:SgcJ/EcaC family oxidoreductase [Actinopolymorpha alba]|uniref:SgcJ/EcaC family oxidoreductase n=1 Tax=Actinopolymorpha alba TaxID=533267 RepID=UPI00037B0589|nr:SgcJ/EcaC family oxidoreductase [Actinopolymorpha alba]
MSDESAIHALLQRLVAAWNAGDARAFAELFTQDADYITFFGAHLHGRTAIEEIHRPLFEGPLRGSRLSGGTQSQSNSSVRLLRPDVAVVVTTGGTTLAGADAPDPERDSIMTLTAVREAGGWRFASFQNTRRTTPPVLAGSAPAGTGVQR